MAARSISREQRTRPRRTARRAVRRSPLLTLLLIASLAAVAGSAAAQQSPPFPDEAFGRTDPAARSTPARSRSTSPPVSPPRRTASPTSPRFSDARPITPAGGESASDTSRGRHSNGEPSLWKSLGALAVIIGLIVGIGKLWKKHGPALPGGLPAEALEVLGKRSVDARQAIHLVRLGSRILVLGTTANGLRTLAEVTDPVEVDYLAGLCRRKEADNSVSQSFRALFNGRPVARPSSNQSGNPPATAPEPATRGGYDLSELASIDAAGTSRSFSGEPHV